MILRDALDIRRGTAQRNKIYKGTYKVWDRNKIALEGYCIQNGTPSPDNEVPIEVMQGRQVVPIQKNRFDKNNANIIDNAYIYQAGATVVNSNGNKTLYIPCKPNTIYNVKKVLSSRFSVGTFSQEPTIGTTINKCVRDYEATELSITTGANDTYLGVWYYRQLSDTTITEQEILNSIEIMENSEYTVDLKSKNWFNVNQEITTDNLSTEGVTLTINTDGIISTSGSNASPYKYIRYDIKLPAGTYIFSGCPAGGSSNGYSSLVQLSGATSSQVLDTGNGNTFTLTETTTIRYFPVRVGSDIVNFNGLVFKPMIRLATVEDDTYEPYYDYKLAGIGDYKDNFYTDKGKWYFKKNIGNGVLDGNNEWILLSGSSYGYFNRNLMEDRARGLDVLLSNYFLQIPAIRGAGMYNGQGNIIFCVEDIQTPEDFKTWLSTHNTEVYYRLANAIITEIPSTYTTLINQLNALYQAM